MRFLCLILIHDKEAMFRHFTYSLRQQFSGLERRLFNEAVNSYGRILESTILFVAYTEFLNRRTRKAFCRVRWLLPIPSEATTIPTRETCCGLEETATEMYQKPADPKDAVPPIEMVNSVDDLLQRVDAVMIFSMDAAASPAGDGRIEAHKPLFISRPLASSAADAVAILKLAQETKTRAGAVRSIATAPASAGCASSRSRRVLVVMSRRLQRQRSEADKFTQSIHSLETLVTIMDLYYQGFVHIHASAESITAVWLMAGSARTAALSKARSNTAPRFSGPWSIYCRDLRTRSASERVVPTNDKYVDMKDWPGNREVSKRTGPCEPAETLEIFASCRRRKRANRKRGPSHCRSGRDAREIFVTPHV